MKIYDYRIFSIVLAIGVLSCGPRSSGAKTHPESNRIQVLTSSDISETNSSSTGNY